LSNLCFECRKLGHFKDECPRLKKRDEKEMTDKDKHTRKIPWKGDKRKKKAPKASWSDSSDNESKRSNPDIDKEVNLSLMANSSEDETCLDELSSDELKDILQETFFKYKSGRKELKYCKNENIHQAARIFLLIEELEETTGSSNVEEVGLCSDGQVKI